MKLKINEMFINIQGESSFSGFPFFFIRTSGCNLRCKYCDTKYAYEDGEFIDISEIIENVKSSQLKNVLITGGEPLIQENIYYLIDSLINNKFNVLIETNGSVLVDKINKNAIKIIDIKTPSSGECNRNNFKNFDFINFNDEIKFVISNYEDFKWSIDVIEKYRIYKLVKNIFLSPVYNILSPKKLANWILEKKLNYVRLHLQLHKIIGIK